MFVGEAEVPANLRVYAIGDIHGCLAELIELLNLIKADVKAQPCSRYKLITIGDYGDRGKDTKGVIDVLISLKSEIDMVCLRGNHDQRMLEFLDIPDAVGESFLHYGGRQTLQSYGITVPAEPNYRSLSRALKRALPKSHLDFLDELDSFWQAGDYYFAHAGVRPGVKLSEQTHKDLLWIREAFLTHQGSFGKVIVHGHTIDPRFDVQPNRINVDTGAFESGLLSCAILENNTVRKLQTRGWI